MSEVFDVKVPIREELKKCLIFRLQARPPIGIILGFVGFRHEVLPITQILSHATRAYIVNADGLTAFILKFDIISVIKAANHKGQLDEQKKWQVIETWKLEAKFQGLNSSVDKMNYLSQFYPCLYIFLLRRLNQTDKIEQYMKQCESYEEDHEKYYIYIQGYFVPWIHQ